MEDIFTLVRDGNAFQVRIWMDNTENDLNQGDDHQFSLLHWASMCGRVGIVEMLLGRGVRVNATNMGDDTSLHLASAHGHLDIVLMLLQHKASVSVSNEHGNTPLHYACFWNYAVVAEELVRHNAAVNVENKFSETPLDKAKSALAKEMQELASSLGQDLGRVGYRDRSWLGYKTRTKEATLSRNSGLDFNQMKINCKIVVKPTVELWKGEWQESEIVVKILSMSDCNAKVVREFNNEYPKLRIFNHPNILPILGACVQSDNLILINQCLPLGSLFDLLHLNSQIVLDQSQGLNFAIDIARGMEFLHSIDPLLVNLNLNSKHVLIDEDLTARINMASYDFPFHRKGRIMNPAWISPEALQKPPSEINKKAADMWSYAVVMWELQTRQVPFGDLSPMQIGMKISMEGLRLNTPAGLGAHMSRLISICMNEEPGKRPSFDMIIPIINKMKTPVV